MTSVFYSVSLNLIVNGSAGQDFKKAQLKHIRPKAVNLIKGAGKNLVAFVRKPRDQIHMHMYISQLYQPFRVVKHRIYIVLTAHCGKGGGIGGLNADFHLKKPLPRLGKEIQGSVIQKICAYFKMKVGHTVIAGYEVSENLIGSLRSRIKGSVDKLNLRRLFIQKISKLALHPVHIEKPH